MKYSLRSLMIVVTLICVVVGGRIEYLRRMAAHHEKEAERYAVLICEEQDLTRDDLDFFERAMRWLELGGTAYITAENRNYEFHCNERFVSFLRHRDLAGNYRNCPPWNFFADTSHAGRVAPATPLSVPAARIVTEPDMAAPPLPRLRFPPEMDYQRHISFEE